MKNTKIIIIVLAAIVFTICVLFIEIKPTIMSNPSGQTACTEEAKLCPDGSYVARSGPLCEFSACPTGNESTTTSQTTTTTQETTSGIIGTVLLGPTCPVMRNPPDPQCADKAYQTSLRVMSSDGIQVIAEFNSNAQGKFTINVPPGEYVIRSASTTNFYPRCSSNTVSVKADMFTETTVSCDTGIR